MEPMALDSWIELWIASTLPLVLYLAAVYYAYQLYRQPSMGGDFLWTWSFLWVQLVVVGVLIMRTRALAHLWYAGRAQAWMVVDPELIVSSWCIGVGLFLHIYLLYQHPVWRTGGPEQLKRTGE